MPANPSHIIVATSRKTVAVPGTAERLSATSLQGKEVHIQALRANTDYVAVGGADVLAASGTETGVVLAPEAVYIVEFTDATNLWVDAVVAAEGVSFTVLGGGN